MDAAIFVWPHPRVKESLEVPKLSSAGLSPAIPTRDRTSQEQKVPRNQDKIVSLEFEFKCPNGHAIKSRVTIFQEPGAGRRLEEQKFSLRCPECHWEGMKLGCDGILFPSAG